MDARGRRGTRAAILWLVASLPALVAAQAAQSTQPAAAATPPEIAFEVVPDFFKLPQDLYFGEAAGVAVNSSGHVFVFSRGNTTGPAYGAAAAQLLEFDAAGHYLREIGHNLYGWSFAHSVRIDRHDNIWVADKGSDVVVRFNPQGRVTLVLGRKLEASDENTHPLAHPKPPLPPVDGLFRQVTDIAWDSDDNIYVSDGYINSRIAKYDHDGNWVGSFGEPGTGPGQFNTPHSIVMDRENRLYVADRGNRRIQVLDTAGHVLRIIHIDVPYPPDASAILGTRNTGPNQPGAPWALCITPGRTQYLYVADSFPGRIYKLDLDGHVLGWLGRAGRQPGQFGWIHALACPSENVVYAAELLNWRVQKLLLHPH
jgi:DNA-binding beta-propeller fold protein YncE